MNEIITPLCTRHKNLSFETVIIGNIHLTKP